MLPAPRKIAKTYHHRALPYAKIGEFMAELRQQEGIGTRALEFAILTAARSGEVRRANWAEFDLDNTLWVVPAERMKAKKEHRVPLSPRAMELLIAQNGERQLDVIEFVSICKAIGVSPSTIVEHFV